jgi:RNA polymerase sigma-70 factor (family 1)
MEVNDFLYEQILIAKLKAGDKSTFSSIFSFYYANLVSFANTILKDTITSEEIVEDCFVYLWENHEVLAITSSLKSYLLKMVQNKCINHIKHMQVENRYSQLVVKYSAIFERDTENYIFRNELESKIEEALNSLPPETKEAFVMSRFEGKKYQEIADYQSVSVRTIEDRISKALAHMRIFLKDYLDSFLILFTISMLNK